MRATLADISEHTGFAKSTVSIALRNDPRLPSATRDAIQNAARRLGYRPNPALAMIAAHRWRQSQGNGGPVLACLYDSQAPAKRVHQAYLAAAGQRAAELGYAHELFDLRTYPNARSLSRVLYQRGVAGVLVTPVYHRELLDGFDWNLFPGVACSVGNWRPPYHAVNTDAFASVQIALANCLAAGYRRIGAALFVHPHPVDDDARRFGAAFVEIARTSPERATILTLDSSPEDEAAFLSWVARNRPEAIVSLHQGALGWLRRAGYRVPEDIAFVCLGGPGNPAIAQVIAQHAEIGRTAIKLLDAAVRHHEAGPPDHPHMVLVTPGWNNGPTLRIPSAGAARSIIKPRPQRRAGRHGRGQVLETIRTNRSR